jgi:hypothetical protein
VAHEALGMKLIGGIEHVLTLQRLQEILLEELMSLSDWKKP